MRYFNVFSIRVFALGLLLSCAETLASSEDFDGQKFVDLASLRYISEVQTAKIALGKSGSSKVKSYAENIIADYDQVFTELRAVSEAANLQMLSYADLQVKAHVYVFERKGEAFDTAYAKKRASERRKTVDLYLEAVNSNNSLLKLYAQRTLPMLMRELYLAQKLVEYLGAKEVQPLGQ